MTDLLVLPDADQSPDDAHVRHVGSGTFSPPARPVETPILRPLVGEPGTIDRTTPRLRPSLATSAPDPDQTSRDDQSRFVGSGATSDHPPEATSVLSPKRHPLPVDGLLLICADLVDDLEKIRIATENRVRSLVQVKGMDDTKERAKMVAITDGLAELEKRAIRELERSMRAHPLGPWVAQTVGVGDKQAARLLAIIGDPATRQTVSQLWAYCGYHVIDGEAARLRKGEKANWSSVAKSRAFLIAEKCITFDGRDDKNGNPRPLSPYRKVYDDARAKYADALHPHDCPQCGMCGTCGGRLHKNKAEHETETGCVSRKVAKAAAGSPLSPGHQHARALRIVAKTVLRDLWIESRRIQGRTDTQATPVAAGLNNETETP